MSNHRVWGKVPARAPQQLVDRLRRSPPELWVVAAAWPVSFAAGSLLYGGDAPLRIYAWAFVFLLVIALFLLRGSRLAWVLVVLGSGAAVFSALPWGSWAWGCFHLVLLALLFMPAARRYVWLRQI